MNTAAGRRLSDELRFYEAHKREWLQNQAGKYVVIKGQTTLGFYGSFEAAYRAGAQKFGVDTDFFVRKISEHEPVFSIY